MTWLNVKEVESALVGLAAAHSDLCERITLPNKTFEKRTCSAVRIGSKAGVGSRIGILFTGSVHGCEWGGADICVSFASDLLEAVATGSGLAYGGKSFTAGEVKAITTSLDVFVFPCVNPDGRHYSQQTDPTWRKNRNPASSGGDPTRIGVDVNRNFDFLWDFATKMDSLAPGASSDPKHFNYHGTAAASEPETRNVAWLLDSYPNIRWFMDIHCHKGDVLYSWGDDQDQSDDPSRSFRATAWDGKRGRAGDAYREYIPAGDLSDASAAAERFNGALTAVRGTEYAVIPGFDLYPTSGASDDYSYSRHLVDISKAKVYAFTLEYGLSSRPEENTFQPAWPVMEEIILEVSSGMVELCLAARPSPFHWLPIRYRRRWPWELWGPFGRWIWPALTLAAVVGVAAIRRALRGRRG